MQEQNVDQSSNSRLNKRHLWKVCLGLLGVALVLALALAPSAMNLLVPKRPDHAQGVADRMGWYLHSGQLQADVRTFAATIQFITANEREVPAVTNVANLPLAESATPNLPKS